MVVNEAPRIRALPIECLEIVINCICSLRAAGGTVQDAMEIRSVTVRPDPPTVNWFQWNWWLLCAPCRRANLTPVWHFCIWLWYLCEAVATHTHTHDFAITFRSSFMGWCEHRMAKFAVYCHRNSCGMLRRALIVGDGCVNARGNDASSSRWQRFPRTIILIKFFFVLRSFSRWRSSVECVCLRLLCSVYLPELRLNVSKQSVVWDAAARASCRLQARARGAQKTHVKKKPAKVF